MNPRQIFLQGIATLILAAPLISAAPQTGSAVLNNQTVLQMHEAGLSPEVITRTIEDADETNFDLTPQGLMSLSRVNLPNEIMATMQRKQSPTYDREGVTMTVNTPELPQEVGVFIETADGLVRIYRKNAKGKLSKTSLATSGLGLWGKATGHNFIPGRTAEAVTNMARPKLIFHLPTYDFGRIRMVKALEIRKDKRDFVNAKSGFAGKGMESNEITFNSTTAGDAYFVIQPAFDLDSGEYALIDYGRKDEPATVWDFSVAERNRPQNDKH